ncbi:exonuclease subunit SbcD [Paraglaciecola sp.]|uniref:exonuclease subunit SbcD n=1 Tax=Paraglaciecola sp. TaxID=1920173 RepID=UPI0030F3FEBC
MKLLHTSDWHLGQSFFTKSRKDEHQAFINWLLKQVELEQIDVVIIAGDIFDTGTPPSYARELYNQFVVDLQNLKCVLVVLGGNHDSVSTLNESKQLLACLNTFVVASTGVALHEQVFCIPDKSGKPGAILCAVPFIRPRDVVQSNAGESGLEKRQALGDAIKQHYASLYQLALHKQQEQQALGFELPIIATGHLTALGVTQSESVRDIYIGTLDGFAADGFPPADYIALGHIHRPQKVAKSEHIRYSGSPIPLSFDELNSQKQVMLVEFAKDKTRTLRPLEVPRFQPMVVIKGDLASIEQQLQQFSQEAGQQTCWLCIEVETQDYLSDLQQRIQSLTEGLNVEVLQLRRSRNKQRQLLSQQHSETLAELSPHEVFELRLKMENFEGDEQQARLGRVREQFDIILSQAQHQDGVDSGTGAHV